MGKYILLGFDMGLTENYGQSGKSNKQILKKKKKAFLLGLVKKNY